MQTIKTEKTASNLAKKVKRIERGQVKPGTDRVRLWLAEEEDRIEVTARPRFRYIDGII